MTILTGYQAIVTDIEDWNKRAAEVADSLYLLQITRLQIVEDGKALKMPVRMVSGSMEWPISALAGPLTIEAFKVAVQAQIQHFVGAEVTPELREAMAEEVLKVAARFDLPPPQNIDVIVESLKPLPAVRLEDDPAELTVKHVEDEA